MGITLEKIGKRIYIRGNTYSIKDELKSLGAKWDPQGKAWWALSEKEDELKQVVKSALAKNGFKNLLVHGRAIYRGKAYYLLFEGETKRGYSIRLTFRDGSKDFWVKDVSDVQILKRYEHPRSIEDLHAYAKLKKQEIKGS